MTLTEQAQVNDNKTNTLSVWEWKLDRLRQYGRQKNKAQVNDNKDEYTLLPPYQQKVQYCSGFELDKRNSNSQTERFVHDNIKMRVRK